MGANEFSTAGICIVVLLCRTSRGNSRITIFGDSLRLSAVASFSKCWLRWFFFVGVVITPRTLRRTRVV